LLKNLILEEYLISNSTAYGQPIEHSTIKHSTIKEFDLSAFAAEIEQIGEQAYNSINHSDFKHLKRVELYGRLASIFGYATAWIIPNPITAFALSLGQFTRWLLMHHISHRGYDKVPNIPKRYTSKGFAQGWRRFIDWFDWVHPVAWDYEHNVLHHYHTGEDHDPDVAERHTELLRELKIPRSFKYLALLLAGLTWKFTYYAPNTLSVIDPENKKRVRKEHIIFITIKNIFDLRNKYVQKLWTDCYLPYATFHFVIIPLLFLPLGQTAVLFVLLNKLLAEAMTNFHSFLVIGPNHTADDLYRFNFHYKDKKEFYLTQITGSANYKTGTEMVDYLSIWLNYQIEHHLFPDLPMLKYREMQPKVKEICARYGVPYKQESIFKRFYRMLNVCVGKTSMQQIDSITELKQVIDKTKNSAQLLH
jgi:fatty acid desaturase